jgi:hypothetical protein
MEVAQNVAEMVNFKMTVDYMFENEISKNEEDLDDFVTALDSPNMKILNSNSSCIEVEDNSRSNSNMENVQNHKDVDDLIEKILIYEEENSSKKQKYIDIGIFQVPISYELGLCKEEEKEAQAQKNILLGIIKEKLSIEKKDFEIKKQILLKNEQYITDQFLLVLKERFCHFVSLVIPIKSLQKTTFCGFPLIAFVACPKELHVYDDEEDVLEFLNKYKEKRINMPQKLMKIAQEYDSMTKNIKIIEPTTEKIERNGSIFQYSRKPYLKIYSFETKPTFYASIPPLSYIILNEITPSQNVRKPREAKGKDQLHQVQIGRVQKGRNQKRK